MFSVCIQITLVDRKRETDFVIKNTYIPLSYVENEKYVTCSDSNTIFLTYLEKAS